MALIFAVAVPSAFAADPAEDALPSLVMANAPAAHTSTPDLRSPDMADASASSSVTEVAANSTPPPSPVDSPSTPPSPAATSTNVTINLIHLMVKRGLLQQSDADDLVKQAQQEADAAQAQAAAAQAAADKVNLVADQAQKAVAQAAAATPPAASDDDMRVTYVPDVVKNQIRDEVKQDVLAQAHEENWATPNAVPDWVKRFRVSGDIRARTEEDMFPSGNATGQILNFNAVNSGGPIGFANGVTLPGSPFPAYNVDQDRLRFRLRARIGAEIDLTQNFTAGLRVGSGSDNSPVSENQTLGGTSGQGGNFSKYAVWIDRAFIRYELGDADRHFSATVGRFDNPFMSTSMIWSDDLAFDGIVLKGKYKVSDSVTPFLTGGAFPVFNTDLNFGTNSTTGGAAYRSYDKYLYAGQAGTSWKINKDFDFKGAVAFYDFENIEGQVSDPISQDDAQFPSYVGPTDASRPAFAQKGNTYIFLRDVRPDAALPVNTPTYQYLGLASPFREVAVTAQLDFNRFDPCHVWLVGEFVKNVAFSKSAIENNGPANLRGPVNNNGSDNLGAFNGGDTGYNIRLNAGKVSLEELGDWNVGLTYRYLESDAVVDGFNDSDFGGGGTNLKGYIIGGNVALSHNVWTGFRWMSAESIAGPPLKEDLFQFDLNAKF